ncbi:AsnC family transcriptional regulator [Halospina denitrificans]|uniref:siroheme decarboxylase n=1 Tax=Halospina denitrificans TaxID=332522 RepID=A0A4R7JR35_9GAMM|nr:Lrp/AsnC family transcriptional regulator [Halospina denitrificans]TDT40254.1 AsnC family transcriptional regulator [Halospina denitrificans]
MQLDATDRRLIDLYQRRMPVTSRPFLRMGEELGLSEQEVINRLEALQAHQIISRVGPVFEHSRAGASLLAAVAAPQHEIDQVADRINHFPGINHNYAREHTFNLWFVMTAPDERTLATRLDELEETLALPVLRLPMIEAYHIDLAFNIDWEAVS